MLDKFGIRSWTVNTHRAFYVVTYRELKQSHSVGLLGLEANTALPFLQSKGELCLQGLQTLARKLATYHACLP